MFGSSLLSVAVSNLSKVLLNIPHDYQVDSLVIPPANDPPRIKLMPVRYQELSDATKGLEETGVSLVSMSGDSLYPSAGYMDDVGLYFAAPLLANRFGITPALAWEILFVSIFLLCFCIGFIGLMKILKATKSKLIFGSLLIALGGVTFVSGDIYFLAPSLSVALLPYVLIFVRDVHNLNKTHVLLFFGLGLIVMASHLTRAHSATAIVLFLFILLFFASKLKVFQKSILIASLLGGIFTLTLFFHFKANERDNYLAKVQPNFSASSQRHPFWHSIYIGLGFLDNDYGIRYLDDFAVRKVQSVSPNVMLFGDEYERLLKEEVIKIIKNDPMFFIRTVAAKTGVIAFYLLFFFNLGLFSLSNSKLLWQVHLAFIVGFAFSVLPGLLAVPNIPYITGGFAFALLYGAVLYDRNQKPISDNLSNSDFELIDNEVMNK